MDLLARAPFHWNGKANTIYWGDALYIINHIRRQKDRVERVQTIPNTLDQMSALRNINLTGATRIEPYQSLFIPIHVEENPGKILLVHPQPKLNLTSLPFLTEVDENKAIHLPFMNDTKCTKELKMGTLLGSFELLSFETVNAIQPQLEQPPLEIPITSK